MKLDVKKLRIACVAVGGPDLASPLHLPERDGTASPLECLRNEWEQPRFSFALRNAVRNLAPGSFAFPWAHEEDGRHVVYVRTASGKDVDRPVPPCFATTETEAWAKALVALHRSSTSEGERG